MTRNDMRFWIWLALVVFLFYGEPDVWGKIHAMVMNMEQCK